MRLDAAGTCNAGRVTAPPVFITRAVDPPWTYYVWNQTPESSFWAMLVMKLDARGTGVHMLDVASNIKGTDHRIWLWRS